jgi:alpha-glucosidase (family GH31 glycosyl hydrolase)
MCRSSVWWFDWWNEKWYSGGKDVTVKAPLYQIGALFAKGGAIIPIDGEDVKERIVFAFPPPMGAGSWSFELVEDDGVGWGGRTIFTLSMTVDEGDLITIDVDVVEREFAVEYDTIWFVFACCETRKVEGYQIERTIEGRRSFGIKMSE